MKTLVIVSHPDILESRSQNYFLNAVRKNEEVMIHHLEETYTDRQIDVANEQALLKQHDRILFQFPFYWYSSPALLKHWQDEVLTDGFAYGKSGGMLAGKEFGLILMIGIKEDEYQAGGKELFSINELTKPFQAVAHKIRMTYLKPLTIFQFVYMNEDKKMEMLIHYLQMLTMDKDNSLAAKESWVIAQLEKLHSASLKPNSEKTLSYAISFIKDNRKTMDELKITLDQM